VRIVWSTPAYRDVDRLQTFLAESDLELSERLADLLGQAPQKLRTFPRRGPLQSGFSDREVRELSVANYRIRYEFRGEEIIVLRIFHSREDR
jgi:plasmid stabilization system protein ParE